MLFQADDEDYIQTGSGKASALLIDIDTDMFCFSSVILTRTFFYLCIIKMKLNFDIMRLPSSVQSICPYKITEPSLTRAEYVRISYPTIE